MCYESCRPSEILVTVFLKQKPCGGTIAFVIVPVSAGEESKPGGDSAQVRLIKPGPGRRRVRLEESVHEPESVWGEDSFQFIQIFCLTFLGDCMEASDIERKVKRTGDPTEFGRVLDGQVGLKPSLL